MLGLCGGRVAKRTAWEDRDRQRRSPVDATSNPFHRILLLGRSAESANWNLDHIENWKTFQLTKDVAGNKSLDFCELFFGEPW